MADIFAPKLRSRIMASIRSTGNKTTEGALATLYRKNGITGWRRKQAIHGKPDFVFRNLKVAVFVDGCFWHGCAQHLRMPATNRDYWLAKIQRNARRDQQTAKALRKAGWTVLRFWEHELRKPSPVVARTMRALAKARATLQSSRPSGKRNTCKGRTGNILK